MTDYSSMRQNDLRLAFAAAASVAPIAVSLDVASASVLLTVRVTAANASHSASIYAALATHLASVASASINTSRCFGMTWGSFFRLGLASPSLVGRDVEIGHLLARPIALFHLCATRAFDALRDKVKRRAC